MVSNVPSDMDEDELIDVLHAKILDDIVSVREVDACRRIVKFSSVDGKLCSINYLEIHTHTCMIDTHTVFNVIALAYG